MQILDVGVRRDINERLREPLAGSCPNANTCSLKATQDELEHRVVFVGMASQPAPHLIGTLRNKLTSRSQGLCAKAAVASAASSARPSALRAKVEQQGRSQEGWKTRPKTPLTSSSLRKSSPNKPLDAAFIGPSGETSSAVVSAASFATASPVSWTNRSISSAALSSLPHHSILQNRGFVARSANGSVAACGPHPTNAYRFVEDQSPPSDPRGQPNAIARIEPPVPCIEESPVTGSVQRPWKVTLYNCALKYLQRLMLFGAAQVGSPDASFEITACSTGRGIERSSSKSR